MKSIPTIIINVDKTRLPHWFAAGDELFTEVNNVLHRIVLKDEMAVVRIDGWRLCKNFDYLITSFGDFSHLPKGLSKDHYAYLPRIGKDEQQVAIYEELTKKNKYQLVSHVDTYTQVSDQYNGHGAVGQYIFKPTHGARGRNTVVAEIGPNGYPTLLHAKMAINQAFSRSGKDDLWPEVPHLKFLGMDVHETKQNMGELICQKVVNVKREYRLIVGKGSDISVVERPRKEKRDTGFVMVDCDKSDKHISMMSERLKTPLMKEVLKFAEDFIPAYHSADIFITEDSQGKERWGCFEYSSEFSCDDGDFDIKGLIYRWLGDIVREGLYKQHVADTTTIHSL